MEAPQSVISPVKNTAVYSEPENKNLDLLTRNSKEPVPEPGPEPVLGVLEIHIHQARDIQNICIYHKQDVYAKVCLTSSPEKFVNTQIINGGGQNPVFNETLKLSVPTIDSTLKCEIYMLSRVRNYLEDQLLGFALVNLSEVLIENGKLEREFTLSSTDLFHSPSGFVQLSLSYDGASPDVIAIPPPPMPKAVNGALTDPESPNVEFEKIEFPDPKIANENHMMVSEYFGIGSDDLVSSDTDDQVSSEKGAAFVETYLESSKPDSPPTSVSTNGSQCASKPESSDFKSTNQECDSSPKEKTVGQSDGSGGVVANGSIKKPVVAITLEPEEKVVQQDFVNLYMKSMQQFTESLAKMKLPLDVESSEQTSSGHSNSDQSLQTPKSTGSRIFYGSRAFF